MGKTIKELLVGSERAVHEEIDALTKAGVRCFVNGQAPRRQEEE